MTNWISCEDSLPEHEVNVLIWAKSWMGSFAIVSYRYTMTNRAGDRWANFLYPNELVTHWMPLPEPPEGE